MNISTRLALELELVLGKLQVQREKCVLGVRRLVALTTGKTGTDTRILDIANLIFYVNTGLDTSVNIEKLDYKKLRYVFERLPEPNRACLVGVW